MDTAQQRRYLDYRDLAQYFVRGGKRALAQAEFVASDSELTQLLELERKGEATAENVRRIVALRRALLRD